MSEQPNPSAIMLRKPKRGRPRAKDVTKTLTFLKPWDDMGISRRTWYRERSRKRRRK